MPKNFNTMQKCNINNDVEKGDNPTIFHNA